MPLMLVSPRECFLGLSLALVLLVLRVWRSVWLTVTALISWLTISTNLGAVRRGATDSTRQQQNLCLHSSIAPVPLHRNASAEDQLYGTWEPSVHFTESGPVPDYVSMVQRFAKEIEEEGLLDHTATGANAV